MPSEARPKKIMEKLNRAQNCSIFGPQNLGSRGGPGPRSPPPPGSAPRHTHIVVHLDSWLPSSHIRCHHTQAQTPHKLTYIYYYNIYNISRTILLYDSKMLVYNHKHRATVRAVHIKSLTLNDPLHKEIGITPPPSPHPWVYQLWQHELWGSRSPSLPPLPPPGVSAMAARAVGYLDRPSLRLPSPPPPPGVSAMAARAVGDLGRPSLRLPSPPPPPGVSAMAARAVGDLGGPSLRLPSPPPPPGVSAMAARAVGDLGGPYVRDEPVAMLPVLPVIIGLIVPSVDLWNNNKS